MSLTAADVAEIMRLVEQSNFDELTLEMEGFRLTLRRGAPAEAPTQLEAQPPISTPRVSEGSPAEISDTNIHNVTSPLLGTFYRAPKPGAPSFVEVGTRVEEETVVAIIEVMKLMNTVRAGVCGTVTDILVADGALAEYGETLLRVRRAD